MTIEISTAAQEHLRTLYAAGLEHRKIYDSFYKAVAKQFNPTLQYWSDDPNTIGEIDTTYLYDNTGWRASKDLADAMHGYSFGRNTPWLRLGLDDPDLMKYGDNAAYLQSVEDWLYFQLQRSNFYDEGWLAVRSAADFSTAIIFREENEDTGVPSYLNIKLARAVLFENRYGEVDAFAHDVWFYPWQAAKVFGYDMLPETIQEAYSDGTMKLFKFVHFVFPWDKWDIDVARKKGKPFISLWFCEYGTGQGWKPVKHDGYDTKCFWVWRWSRNPDGSPLGCDSPGMMEVSNSQQLQGMRKDYHRVVQMTGRVPTKGSESLKNRINLTPNGFTALRPGEDFAPAVGIAGNPQWMMQDAMSIQEGIKESYYTKLFMTLTSTLAQASKTATEIEAVRAEQSALLTAVSGRMNTEFLEPAVEDLFSMERAALRLAPPPRSLNGKSVHVVLVSPLAILQRKYLRLDTTKQALGEIFAIAQMDPTAMDNVDLGKYARLVAEVNYMDRTVLRDLVDVERIRKGRAQLQAAQIQAEQQAQQAQAARNQYGAMRQAPEPGSPAAVAMGGGGAPAAQ